uniref:uncharacterized protein LOC122595130 n=1 Tax=Erigeron canadensis TaxID=72917 RepID=UPI001CB963CD|nr:uncharacterized protein LOC122595130 [Erigeron canadensis]
MTSSPSSFGNVSWGEDSGDKYLGYRRSLKDEAIVKLLQQMAKGKSVQSKHTAEETYLFDDHPAIVLEPCLRDETEYYLIYTTLPNGIVENRIVDGDGGIWETTILPRAITEYGRGIGKRQAFMYKPSHCSTSSWRMVMYSLDFGDRSDHVICKVFEALDSETAKAVRAAAEAEAYKIKLWQLRAAAQAEAQTSKKRLKDLRKEIEEAEENATNLVAARKEVARKGLIELRQIRASGNNENK